MACRFEAGVTMPMMPPRHRPPGMPTREEAERRRLALLDQRRPSRAERGYDADWRRCRNLFAKAYPVCCVSGCGKPTAEVDHIQSIRDRPDLRLNWSNLRPMCRSHHSQRTARDQVFARSRAGVARDEPAGAKTPRVGIRVCCRETNIRGV